MSLHTNLDYHNLDDCYLATTCSSHTSMSNGCILGTASIDGDKNNNKNNSCSSSSSSSSGKAAVYDEVEDLFQLLQEVKHTYPDIQGVSCGAIISTYQRLRVENVCSRLNLTCLAYLWQRDRMELLHEMMTYDVDGGTTGISSNGDDDDDVDGDNDHCYGDSCLTHSPIDAVLIKVAGAGLDPLKHLNRSLASLLPVLTKLHHQLGLDVCGEGGEYESLVLDCSAFKKYRLVLEETTVVVDEENCSVGYLKITKCSCQLKDSGSRSSSSSSSSSGGNLIRNNDASLLYACQKIIGGQRGDLIGQKCASNDHEILKLINKKKCYIQKAIYNNYNKTIDNSTINHHNHGSQYTSPTISINKDGIGQTSLIFSINPVQTEGILDKYQQIKLELKEIMTNLQQLLSTCGVILADIVFIHLYIERYGDDDNDSDDDPC